MPRHGPAKLCPTFCMVLLESSGHCGSEMGDFPTAQDIMCTSQCKLHATVSHPNPRNQAPASSSPYRIFRLRGPLRDFMQTGRSPAAAYTQELATHAAVHPPSTGSATPVMYEASSLNKKDTYTQCTHVLGQPSAQCMRGLDAALPWAFSRPAPPRKQSEHSLLDDSPRPRPPQGVLAAASEYVPRRAPSMVPRQ
jgi:hypothetical protein